MTQRGRKRPGTLTVPADAQVVREDRPEPPLDLTPEQSDEWTAIVEALPANWFKRESFPLLSQLCRHVVEARRIAQLIDHECSRDETDITEYERLLKMQQRESTVIKAMSASLRVSPQSTLDAEKGMRRKAKREPVKRIWES